MTEQERYLKASKLYLQNIASDGCSPKTLEAYEGVLKSFGLYCFADDKNPAEVNFEAVTGWKGALAAREVKSSTVAYYLNILRNFFEWVCDPAINLYERNPVSKILIPKNHGSAGMPVYTKLLDENEYMELLTPDKPVVRGLSDDKWLRDRAIMLLFLTSGIRNSELISISPSDLDYEKSLVRVIGKGRKPRLAPFDALAQIAVKNYLASPLRPAGTPDDAPLFGTVKGTGEWHPFTRQGISKMTEKVVNALAERGNIRSHALRHNAASYWLLAGVPLEDIQAALGHSNIATTQIYAKRLSAESHIKSINEITRMKEYRIQSGAYEQSEAMAQ